MTKRSLLWIASATFFVLSLAGIVYGIGKIESVTLTENQVQAMVEAKLPFSKKKVTVNAIYVQFQPDVVQLSFTVDGQKFKQAFHVSAQATGELVYNSFDGTFHFRPHDIKINELTLRDGKISERVEGLIDRFVGSEKIVANKKFIGSKADEWVHSAIVSAVTFTLKTVPVYTLPNDLKGNAVRMLLESVEIDEGTITAHLSFWQLTKIIMLYGLILLVSIGMFGALFMYPGLGMAALMIGSLGDS